MFESARLQLTPSAVDLRKGRLFGAQSMRVGPEKYQSPTTPEFTDPLILALNLSEQHLMPVPHLIRIKQTIRIAFVYSTGKLWNDWEHIASISHLSIHEHL